MSSNALTKSHSARSGGVTRSSHFIRSTAECVLVYVIQLVPVKSVSCEFVRFEYIVVELNSQRSYDSFAC